MGRRCSCHDIQKTSEREVSCFFRGRVLGHSERKALVCKVEGHRRTTWCCWETDWFDGKAKQTTVDSLK